MKNHRIVNQPIYNSLPINNNGSGCHGEILDLIRQRLDASLSRYSRVHITRLDITFPEGWTSEDNHLFSKFLWELRKVLGGELFNYVWVAEQNSSLNQHFHLIIFRNGQQHRSGYSVWQAATLVWGKLLGCIGEGLVHVAVPSIDTAYCNYGVVLDRNASTFMDAYSDVYYWLSYMAKTNTKTTESGHSHGASHLSPLA